MSMYVKMQETLKSLNVPDSDKRLENLKLVLEKEQVKPQVKPQYANNHIHTCYSFSPYSPTAAIYMARAEGLQTAGIMDHDSIAGADEFRKAGDIAGIGTTCGMECRVDFSKTRLAGRKLNNPDQDGIAYMAIHSVPATGFKRLQEVFEPLRQRRNERNKKMLENINSIMAPFEIQLDFQKDVVPLSYYSDGGSVTERHLLYALSLKIIDICGIENCAEFVGNTLKLPLSEKQINMLSDPENPHLAYDLLGVLKAQLVSKIYIPATDECLSLKEVVKLSDEVGAILCYAYLGDVTNSVTGDKKAAKFEDDYLDELFITLREEGVNAVTYMPARNTDAQIKRLQKLCQDYSMTEISGEDVNTSRQSMICKQLELPQFSHLVDMAWKLVEREKL
ncbi:MAG: PHP domain-containing protein [Clostridia bacterium]|nr:PHP domain-containing protein [Clostridia bacterium]